MESCRLWAFTIFSILCGISAQSVASTTQMDTSSPIPTTKLTTIPTTNVPTTNPPTTNPPTTNATTTTEAPLNDYGILITGYPTDFDAQQINLLLTTPQELDLYSGAVPGVQFDSYSLDLVACALDYRQKNLFVYDYDHNRLMIGSGLSPTANEDSMTFADIHYGVSKEKPRLAVDWISHNVYWTDPNHNWIAMQPASDTGDQSMFAVIARGDLHKPRGLTIDPNYGWLFFTGVASPPVIERCQLDGASRKVLLSRDLYEPNDIAADPINQKLYWIDDDNIWTMDYEGQNKRHLGRDYTLEFMAIEVYKDAVMVTDYDDGYIRVYNADSSQLEEMAETYSSPDEYFMDIAMYHEDAQPMINDGSSCVAKGCSEICVAQAPSFDAICLCREGSYLATDEVTCVVDQGVHNRAIIFTDGLKICKLDVRTMSDFHQSFLDTMNCFYTHNDESDPIRFLEVNNVARTLYFATESKIFMIDMDATNPIPENIENAPGIIGGISYNWNTYELYFTNIEDTSPHSIGISSMETDVTYYFDVDTDELGDLIVLPHHNAVFFTSKVNDSYSDINMAELDISGGKTVQTLAGTPYGYVHDISHDRLAFVVDGVVRSINYTGEDYSGLEYMHPDAVTFTLYQEYYLEMIDDGGETKFSANQMGRYSGASEGTLPNVGVVVDIVMYDPELQPSFPNPCGFMNGGCDHLCLPKGPVRTCLCSKGFQLQDDGTSCDSTLIFDDFALLVDKSFNLLLQVPLDEALPIAGIKTSDKGSLLGVMYNYLTNKIVWSSYTEDQILEIGMDGTGEKVLVDTYRDHYRWASPDRMVLDPSTGNIYYTGVSWFGFPGDSYIGVVAPNGNHTTLEIDQTMASPRDLQIDPERGLIFWVDISWSYAGVFRAYMDGSNSEQLVSTSDVEGPAGIALDRANQMFYFTDGYADKIYSCSYTCTEGITEIHEEPGSSMEDVGINGGYLYLTAWNLPYIVKINMNSISDITKLRQNDALGRLNAMDLYRSQDVVTVHTECSINNGGCSHFCLPTPLGFTCGCEDGYGLLPDGKSCENIPRCPLFIANATLEEDCLGLPEISCAFTCKENFRLRPGMGNSQRCLSNVSWEYSSPCEEILCTDTVPNGALTMPCPQNVGAVCIGGFTCNAGYEPLPGVGNLTCKPDGTWSTAPALLCEPKCPSEVSNGALKNCDRNPGDTCSFECDYTYKPKNNNSEVQCKSDSQWNRDRTEICEEIMCPAEKGFAVMEDGCTRKVGVRCLYSCLSNYTINVDVIHQTCQISGKWNHTANPKASLCLAPVTPTPAPAKDNTLTVVLAVTITLIVILILVIIILSVIMCRNKGVSMPYSSRSMSYHTGSIPGEGAVGIENPQYLDMQATGSTNEGNKDFGYATLESDNVTLTEEKNGKY